MIPLFHPVKDFSFELKAFNSGRPFKSKQFSAEVGQVFPKLTIRLPPVFDVSGRLVDADGEPIAKSLVRVRAIYNDGEKQTFNVRTDEDGKFEQQRRLHAGPLRLEIRRTGDDDVGGKWKSDPIDPEHAESLDLGDVRIAAEE